MIVGWTHTPIRASMIAGLFTGKTFRNRATVVHNAVQERFNVAENAAREMNDD